MGRKCNCKTECMVCSCNISAENRAESANAIKSIAATHRKKILDALTQWGEGLTAVELGTLIMNDDHRQKLAPRLTELKKAEMVRVVGKKINPATGRNTSIYEVI